MYLLKTYPYTNISKDRTTKGTVAPDGFSNVIQTELGSLQEEGPHMTGAFRDDKAYRATSHNLTLRPVKGISNVSYQTITTFLLAADKSGTMCLGGNH